MQQVRQFCQKIENFQRSQVPMSQVPDSVINNLNQFVSLFIQFSLITIDFNNFSITSQCTKYA